MADPISQDFHYTLTAIFPWRQVEIRREYAKLSGMTVDTASLLALCAYLISAGLWATRQRFGLNGIFPQAFAWAAVALHALIQGLYWQQNQGPDLHFFSALSWVALVMAALTALMTARKQLSALGVLVYPLAALALLANWQLGVHQPNLLDWRLKLHAILALLAYASLSIATLLALLYWLQDRALRRRHLQLWLGFLPPLVQTEQLLFKTLGASWLLLTLTLVTGLVFVQDMLAQNLWHKTVLTALSWLVLLILLIGRLRWGWRGARAVHWTLGAMALLALAFFGSKFALEFILQRA
jgi:ABC-type uncharacterized transport system permease subunit